MLARFFYASTDKWEPKLPKSEPASDLNLRELTARSPLLAKGCCSFPRHRHQQKIEQKPNRQSQPLRQSIPSFHVLLNRCFLSKMRLASHLFYNPIV